jgi:hypothetical protein
LDYGGKNELKKKNTLSLSWCVLYYTIQVYNPYMGDEQVIKKYYIIYYVYIKT